MLDETHVHGGPHLGGLNAKLQAGDGSFEEFQGLSPRSAASAEPSKDDAGVFGRLQNPKPFRRKKALPTPGMRF